MVSKLLFLSVPLVIAICYFCNPYIVGYFGFHPICMTLAFSLLSVNAILTLTGRYPPAILQKRDTLVGGEPNTQAAPAVRTFSKALEKHRLFHFLALSSGIAGVACVAYSKYERGKPHLVSPHAICGAIALALYFFVMLAGNSMFVWGLRRVFRTPYWTSRLAHSLAGLATLGLATLALLGGIDSAFMHRNAPNEWVRLALSAGPCLVFIGVILAVIRARWSSSRASTKQ